MQLQYKVTGSLIHSCLSFLVYQRRKERGSKGRAIYRAVGSQVTYATPCDPCRIRSARNTIYNLYLYRHLVLGGSLSLNVLTAIIGNT